MKKQYALQAKSDPLIVKLICLNMIVDQSLFEISPLLLLKKVDVKFENLPNN